MKQMNSISLLTTALLFVTSQVIFAQVHECTWHNDYTGGKTGDPFIENNCFAPIDKYLARTIYMAGLVSVNTLSDWGSQCDIDGTDFGQGCYFNSSMFGYTCNGYCPERYWCDIDVCTDLNAAMLYDVATLWGSENLLTPNSNKDYWYKISDAIVDINKAYDAAGLRRPIIGATIFEYITDLVNYVPIPQYVIDAFADEMAFAQFRYYTTHHYFVYSRISQPPFAVWPQYPTSDMNKLEARMWYYYCATQYINAGYTLINLGALTPICHNDIGYSHTYTLFSKIREYAQNKGQILFLCAGAQDNIFYGSNNLLVDFYILPIRPMESSYSACLPSHLVNYVSQGLINYFSPGWNSFGCYESPHALYSLCYDNTGGVLKTLGNTNPSYYGEDYIVWGYDEARWFYQTNLGSDQCAEDELTSMMSGTTGIRSLADDTRGYIQVPGRTDVAATQEEIDNGEDIGHYRLYDHPDTKNKVYNPSQNTGLWKPNDNTSITTTTTCFITGDQDDCDLHHFGGIRTYTFRVPQPDNTTVYTWHIQNPDGSWQPYTYGTSRTFTPPSVGNYSVHLRQDNMGFAANTYGTIEHAFTKYLDPHYCCGPYHNLKVSDESDSTYLSTNNLYPNPAVNRITISSATELKIISIFNLFGEMVKEEKATGKEATIDISSLSQGLYVVEADRKMIGKFVKE